MKVTKNRSAWPWILALATLCAYAGSVHSLAQTTAASSDTLSQSSSSLPQGANDLPSAVSPAIARFLETNGRHLLTSPPTVPPGRPSDPASVRTLTPLAPARTREDYPAGVAVASQPSIASPDALSSAGSSPLEGDIKLKPAPLERTDVRFPINLATALRLSDARPLIIAAAQASVWVAEAQLTRAKVLWVPTGMIGFDYIRHDGGGPDFNKGIMTAPSVNYFMGGVAANLYVNLSDAIFEPLVARQVLNSSHWDIQAAKNDSLQQTADSYFRVHQARGRYAGALYTVERGRDLARRVEQLSKELVPKDEVDRARNMLADLEQRSVSAREDWRIASADLTQVLRLDPRAVVDPLEDDHLQITLIDPARDLDELMPIALNNRPELSSRRAQILAAEARVRREKMRPALPAVLIGGFQHAGMYLQAGIFGIGPNSSLDQWRGREDVSLQLIWQLEGMGFGNLARIKQQRGQQSEAMIRFRHTQDAVVAEVTRAVARVQSAAARVLQADRALRTGIIAFNGHLEGLEQTRRLGDVLVLSFRPQEAVYSLELLNIAFNEYFTTVAEYNRAQFELFHAVGYPAEQLAQLRPPGDIIPVELLRPDYLPPVGTGPPPATR